MNRKRITAGTLVLGAGLLALSIAGEAQAITRSAVLARAKAFAYHPWTCTSQNLLASCNGSYTSIYTPGDYVGLPYDWGGYMTLFEFDQGILAGKGAGSYPEDGILSCTVGLDCSGFVSKAFDAGHYTTSNMSSISTAIDVNSLLPGDIFNYAGYHVAMYSHTMANGEPALYESLGYNVHYNVSGGWSHVDGYIPRRYTKIEGTTVSDLAGTPATPIKIGSFPYTDTRSTKDSQSDVLDGCGAAPAKSESGPEYVYEVTFTQPGTLTATISDDAGVDIDIHLYTSMSTNDCVARHDTTITVDVDCGTYYLVADTFKGATEQPGLYTLTATFTPKNQPCGDGPPQYSPEGQPGDPCGNPYAPDLPFCNPNLGGDVCLYTDQISFCTMPCEKSSDCTALGAGACCGDIGGGELYCFTKALCGNADPPDQMDTPDGGDPKPGDLTGGAAGAGTGGAGASSAGGAAGAGAGIGAGVGGSGGGSNNLDDPGSEGGCNASDGPASGGRL
ncbi:MAG: hypothetical protein R3B70_49330, partial [Polyangiaceae bacterium]